MISIDFEGLAEMGVNSGRTNVDEIHAAPLHAVNDRGGIHGRMLKIIPVKVVPIGGASHDAACVQLTQDDPVFVVVGAPGANLECCTVLNNTAVIAAGGMSDARLESALAPCATVAVNNDTEVTTTIGALIEAGVFDGQVVGLTGAVDASEDSYDRMAEALADAGIELVDGLVGENEGTSRPTSPTVTSSGRSSTAKA